LLSFGFSCFRFLQGSTRRWWRSCLRSARGSTSASTRPPNYCATPPSRSIRISSFLFSFSFCCFRFTFLAFVWLLLLSFGF
jgi:hypothetical protein